MIIILDVNVLLSALIKDSITREIIIKSGQQFCFPEPSLDKIRKYKKLILEKAGFSKLEFIVVLNTLFRFILTIPTEEIMLYWEEAKEIMNKIDPEDATIMAAALSREEAIIWSNDEHFRQQNRLLSLKTKDIFFLFKDMEN